MDYYFKCLKEYANFKGRARRKELWLFTLFDYFFMIFFIIVDNSLHLNLGDSFLGILSTLYIFGTLIPRIAVQVRRLHDVGKSGLFYFLIFVGIGGIMIFIFNLRKGEEGENEYGPDPLDPNITDVDKLETEAAN